MEVGSVADLKLWKPERKNEYAFYNQKTGERFVDLDAGLELACTKAEIEGVTWHTLRYTFASRLLERGADINYGERMIGALNGHRDHALHASQSCLEGGSGGQAGGHRYKSATPCTRMQQQG
jgi:integrase